VRRALFSRSAT
jgi:hypothetical protein